jgi:hypothetical protein
MELLKNIRLRIGKLILANKVARIKRKVFYSNINNVKKIVIVWDASKTDEFSYLSKFHQKMHQRKIEVSILGYFPGKILPDRYTAIRYLTCITNKEINFFYFPVSPETNRFINNRAEILIDINFERVFPLQYISSLSNAGFKVGLFDSKAGDTPFDLMMEIREPINVESYLNQIIHYLEMINSGEANKID